MESRFTLAVFVATLALLAVVNADVARPMKRYFPAASKQLATKIEDRGFCSESYSPCTCNDNGSGHEISCVNVAVDKIQQIFFNSVTPRIFSLELVVTAAAQAEQIDIPADLLSEKRVQNLYLRCPESITKKKLSLNAYAFRFTRDYTSHFEIGNCDLAELPEFLFLAGFDALHELFVLNSDNVNLATLPQLRNLTKLLLSDSTGIQENAAAFPSLTPARVSDISFRNCQLDDVATSTILAKITASTSAGSLLHIDLSGNILTRVPAEVHGLAQLADLVLTSNAIKETKVGDLGFVSSVKSIYLDNNGLEVMEANTFEFGDFTYAQVHLEANLLEVFAKDVFFKILTQMAIQPVGAAGYVDILGNPVKCNCDLAWLIRDNYSLLPYVRNGKCGDFFDFEDLNESAFNECPPS